jgi:hypothetical protein
MNTFSVPTPTASCVFVAVQCFPPPAHSIQYYPHDPQQPPQPPPNTGNNTATATTPPSGGFAFITTYHRQCVLHARQPPPRSATVPRARLPLRYAVRRYPPGHAAHTATAPPQHRHSTATAPPRRLYEQQGRADARRLFRFRQATAPLPAVHETPNWHSIHTAAQRTCVGATCSSAWLPRG